MKLDIFRALFSNTSLRTECYWDSHWWILVNSGSRDYSSYPWLAQGCCSWKETCWPEACWWAFSTVYFTVCWHILGSGFISEFPIFILEKWMYKAIKEIMLLLNVKSSLYFLFSNNRLFALILLLIFMRDWWRIHKNVIGRILLFSLCFFFFFFFEIFNNFCVSLF